MASESVVSMSSQNRSYGTRDTPETLPERDSGRAMNGLTIQYPDEVPLPGAFLRLALPRLRSGDGQIAPRGLRDVSSRMPTVVQLDQAGKGAGARGGGWGAQ